MFTPLLRFPSQHTVWMVTFSFVAVIRSIPASFALDQSLMQRCGASQQTTRVLPLPWYQIYLGKLATHRQAGNTLTTSPTA